MTDTSHLTPRKRFWSNVSWLVLGLVLGTVLSELWTRYQYHQPTQNPLASQPSTAAAHQLPTATEVFHLRSECAQLGEKILNNNFIGRALTQSQVSHYNPKTNRCHVELTVQSADMTKPPEVMSGYLFDGQTGEMLAYARIEKGKQSGMSFKKGGIIGFEEARSYIDEVMKDD